jgi:hypothetical protein
MSAEDTTPDDGQIETNDSSLNTTERELIDDLILQNKTLDALIKGLANDIEIFKSDEEKKWTPADIVRFTMQLNIMKDKKARNLTAINNIIKEHRKQP